MFSYKNVDRDKIIEDVSFRINTTNIIKIEINKFIQIYRDIIKNIPTDKYINQISTNLLKILEIIKEIKKLGSLEYEYTLLRSGLKTLNNFFDKSKLLSSTILYVKCLIYNLNFQKIIEAKNILYMHNFIENITLISNKL